MFFRKKKFKEQKKAAIAGICAGIFEVGYLSAITFLVIATRHIFIAPSINYFNWLVFYLIFFVFSLGISLILIFGYPIFLLIHKRLDLALIALITSFSTIFILGFLLLILSFFINFLSKPIFYVN